MWWKMVKRTALSGQRKYQVLASSSLNTDTLSSDPSVPPANGASRLTALPIELLRLIAADLDQIGLRGVRHSSKTLRTHLDAPPIMTRGEHAQFQKQLEAHASRKLKTLFCSFCSTFKSSTPSKATFTDAQAVQNYSGRRACISCGIANGHYDKRDVVIKKKKLFACGGCREILPQDKEDTVVADVVVTKAFPWHDQFYGSGAEMTIGSGGKRWCRQCRVAIGGLRDSDAIKVKTVPMP